MSEESKFERLIELTKRHKTQMDEKNVLISVYTNENLVLSILDMEATRFIDMRKEDQKDTFKNLYHQGTDPISPENLGCMCLLYPSSKNN